MSRSGKSDHDAQELRCTKVVETPNRPFHQKYAVSKIAERQILGRGEAFAEELSHDRIVSGEVTPQPVRPVLLAAH